MTLTTINPATGEAIRSYEQHSADEIESILERANRSFEGWRRSSFEDRAALLREVASLLRSRLRPYAELMAIEMGKPLAQGEAEAEKCAWVCEYYADRAADFLADEPVETDAGESFVACRPLGAVLAVMPWNFPFWQVLRFAAPSLAAGNTAVLKHASNVTGCALAIETLFRDAGAPAGLFQTLVVDRERVGDVIDDSRVRAVTLTGSVGAGRAVAARAGRALKKTVLELGGSDPYLILADADLESAVEACVTSRMINSGQSCIAAKRFVVVESIAEDFEQRLVAAMEQQRMGDPFERGIDLGPQARADLRDELHDQVTASIDAGARCLLGGEVPEQPGAWYPPTVLTDVVAGMPASDEELFGPVAAILEVESEEEAIEVANASSFGLGAAVFSRDEKRARTIARERLEAGSCFVNDFVRSDPRLPFGGIRDSGYGRELGSLGIREFVNAKTVWVS